MSAAPGLLNIRSKGTRMLVPAPKRRARGVPVATWIPLLPLLVVTLAAGYGQVLFGIDVYSPAWWPIGERIAVAVFVAGGIEAIALYVGWHAHDALLMKAGRTAARLRRASYLIAAGVGLINYSHFAIGWNPTPAAVVFALFSASSPWLWGLHTRRAQRVQLLREGHIDATGATFALERWRAYPLRTWQARRYSIDYSIVDPAQAWSAWREIAAARRAARRAVWIALRAAVLHRIANRSTPPTTPTTTPPARPARVATAATRTTSAVARVDVVRTSPETSADTGTGEPRDHVEVDPIGPEAMRDALIERGVDADVAERVAAGDRRRKLMAHGLTEGHAKRVLAHRKAICGQLAIQA